MRIDCSRCNPEDPPLRVKVEWGEVPSMSYLGCTLRPSIPTVHLFYRFRHALGVPTGIHFDYIIAW